ncbi:TSUP family transporter [Geobacter sp. FeAm09]|uniref:TSUP family transporter n=1 Tax=Geobacter sp. FeAm09 TaxID=2597769 RepID=UPI0011EE6AEA|nr:TSUP family transporter [Geobacter sp. FeAm09]QEM69417.1 TSUP family transporter [Geobacter sp. FeAm09]
MPALLLLPLLFLTGLVAGLVDSIAGGGGLITIPVLLGVGMPPQAALGTNKLQASFGSGSAMLTFVRSGTVRLDDCRAGIAYTAIGAALGTITVQMLDPALLRHAIPWLLVAIVLYTLLTPRLGYEDIHARVKPGPFFFAAGLVLGFYDGFLGPGTGSFWVMALMLGLGFNMTRATGYTKVMNFTSNVASLALFICGGSVLWREGLIMGVGQFVGARIGARMVVRKGTRFIRPVFVTMVLAITAKLIWQNFH